MPSAPADLDIVAARPATPDEITSSRSEWNALAASMRYPSIFCTWEWIHTWWVHFGLPHKPMVLFIHRGSRLTGILPLFLNNGARSGLAFPRKLDFCGSTRLGPDHLDIICSSDDAPACIDAAFDYLTKEFTGWDTLHLPNIAEDSQLFSWLHANRERFNWREKDRTFAPYIRLAGTFDDYMSSFTSRQRYPILSRRRKLFEKHEASYVKCNDGETTRCLETVFELHSKRAEKKQMSSSFAGEEIFEFHSDLLKQMRGKHWTWIRFLKAGDRIIATIYGFRFGNRIFYFQTGQDPEWQSFSPGTVIIHESIREAYEDNCVEYNFLQGEEEYKYKWTKNHRALHEVILYHGNLQGRLLGIKDSLKEAAKKLLRRAERHPGDSPTASDDA